MFSRAKVKVAALINADAQKPRLIHFIAYQIKNNRLYIIEKGEQESAFEKYKGKALHIIVASKNLILKEMSFNSKPYSVSEIIPGTDDKSFFLETINSVQNQYCAFLPIQLINGLIKQFINQGYFVTELSIAELSLPYLGEYLEKPSVSYANKSYAFNNNELLRIADNGVGDIPLDLQITIEEDVFQNEATLVLGGILSSLNQSENHKTNLSIIQEQQMQLDNQQKLKQLLTVFGISLLSLLLFNFGLNQFFQSKLEQSKSTDSLQQQTLQQKDQLETELKELRAVGISIESKRYSSSYYLDELAQLRNDKILWQNVVFQPRKSRKKEDGYSKNLIVIKAETSSTLEQANFVKNISEQPFCKQVNVTSIKQTKNGNNEFEIAIDVE